MSRMSAPQTATIETSIPARLDRLPWARFHNRVLFGLGLVWILDGLEVTMVGSVASRLTDPASGVGMTSADIGTAAAIYVVGSCLGALVYGRLTDRFGRRKLFIITLGVYIGATVLTAFTFAPWFFFLARFLTGTGIGGEYAAVNSAVDEMIPARTRGRADLLINGTYWLGATAAAGLTVVFLDETILAAWLGWRLAFALGALLGFSVMVVRRNVPESPRWLFIHGRQDQAEKITEGIENEVQRESGTTLEPVEERITIRQRSVIPFRLIAETAFKRYPKRSILGLALFVGQAFIYNGITFDLGNLLSRFYGVPSGTVPIYIAIYSFGNFLGPLLLGKLFDTIGRKPMIMVAYLGSALLSLPLALVFLFNSVSPWGLLALIVATFFLASTGASAAYLTVSEIFPMEMRALAIAFFYAVGTAIGGITGPLLFGQLIASGDRGLVTIGFFITAVVMAIGGFAELAFGVNAERSSLEDIAQPLTAAESSG